MADAELLKKRRLPLWMSSSSSSTLTTTTTSSISRRKETSSSIEEEEEFVPAKRAGTRKRLKKESVQLDTTTDPPVESKATRNRSKKQVAAEPPQSHMNEKKKNKSKTRRQQFSDEEDMSDSVSNEEDDNRELTVDDLMSIAQEYVKADIEKENHQKQRVTSESGVQQTSSLNDFVESAEVLLPTTTSTSSMVCNSDHAVAVNQDSSTTTYNPISGDSAQDMLDLFLGPLLKKPAQTREATKQSEAAACAAFTEEIALDNYIWSQKMKKQEEEVENAVKRKPVELPAVPKKKSSLRDKVAMFFD